MIIGFSPGLDFPLLERLGEPVFNPKAALMKKMGVSSTTARLYYTIRSSQVFATEPSIVI
ncbi:MAG TPA: hypothetical protein DCF68_10485 [Cyanothece sp. UBA12306]|nr:hypothetical protein [Cyanothece sp. UBA12306]